jgi:hypothetical protein
VSDVVLEVAVALTGVVAAAVTAVVVVVIVVVAAVTETKLL